MKLFETGLYNGSAISLQEGFVPPDFLIVRKLDSIIEVHFKDQKKEAIFLYRSYENEYKVTKPFTVGVQKSYIVLARSK